MLLVVAAGCGGDDAGGDGGGATGDLVATGEELFGRNCAVCHGAELDGTSMGPPLRHEVYAPDHHPDEAFHRAVAEGVQPHHWNFGPMPPLPDVGRDDVDAIVAYVRDRQETDGFIEAEP